MKIVFAVACLPIAQPRQRTRVVAAHGRTFAQNYTPAKATVNAFKAAVALAAADVRPSPVLVTGPLAVKLVFVFPRPARLVWKTRPMPRTWHASKPDAENVAKAVLDALTNVLWKDDAQVCDLSVSKRIAAGDEAPSVTVSVETLGEYLPGRELARTLDGR